MLNHIFEMLETFLVNLGMALSRLSDQEKTTVSIFLASLLVAAVVAHALLLTFGR